MGEENCYFYNKGWMKLTGSDPGPFRLSTENNDRSFKTLDLHHHNLSNQTSYVIEDNFERINLTRSSTRRTLYSQSVLIIYVSNSYPSYSWTNITDGLALLYCRHSSSIQRLNCHQVVYLGSLLCRIHHKNPHRVLHLLIMSIYDYDSHQHKGNLNWQIFCMEFHV